VTKTALAFLLVAGLALFAQTARAGVVTSPLAEGFWFIENANDPNGNTCEVGVDGTDFEAFGDVSGTAQATAVDVTYDTLQPTSTSRNEKSISVKQSSFSTLNVLFDGVTVSGNVAVQKCSVSGSVNTVKATGSTSVSCSGNSITDLLTVNDVAIVQAALDGKPNVKFKVNNNGKWSLTIKCKGDASLD
jgi:hypothetical protein